jgi:acetyl-CoA carboxylase biotin carboxyl carrier protein
MFTFDQIREFVELVSRHRLHNLEIEHAGFRLRISGESAASTRDTAAPAVTAPAPGVAAAVAAPGAASPPPAPTAVALHVVASPIVGTFYSSPSPDSPAYVKVGDRVSRGQVLCIVEAMKLMNEIECDADGVVAEIYPKNAQPVEYGEPLFGLRTD